MTPHLLPHGDGEGVVLIIVFTEPFITTHDAQLNQFLRLLNRQVTETYGVQ